MGAAMGHMYRERWRQSLLPGFALWDGGIVLASGRAHFISRLENLSLIRQLWPGSGFEEVGF